MPFSERTKLNVKKRADFTCCWCQDRRNRVHVHHIIPEAEGGPDNEDNAAPLCASCHDSYGANRELRKEIRTRRDHWYQTCSRQSRFLDEWPLGLDVPLLDFYQRLPPRGVIASEGIQFTDKEPTAESGPPVLYLSVYLAAPPYPSRYGERLEKWLRISAHMRFAFHLGINVCAWSDLDALKLTEFLREENRFCELIGRESTQGLDIFVMFNEDQDNRLVLGTITPTRALILIRARFSRRMLTVLADYLEEVGFARPFEG